MRNVADKIALIRASIADLKQVNAIYQGLPRLFCPHILGIMSERWAVRGWQFGGLSSRPNQLPMWRNFFLDELTDVTSQGGDWQRGWMTGARPHGGFDSVDTVVAPEFAAELRHTSTTRIPGLEPRRQGRRR